MAKVRSPLFTAVNGSIGNTTWSQNRYCSVVVRRRPNLPPGYVPTPFQLFYQEQFRNAVRRWSLLTEQQRLDWIRYALTCQRVDSIGNSIILPGEQMYISVRMASITYNPSFPDNYWDDAPTTVGPFPRCVIIDHTVVSSGKINFEIYNPSQDDVMGISCFRTSDLPPTINYYKGPYAPDLFFTIDHLDPLETLNYEIKDLVPDRRYFFRFRCLRHDPCNIISSYVYHHFST